MAAPVAEDSGRLWGGKRGSLPIADLTPRYQKRKIIKLGMAK